MEAILALIIIIIGCFEVNGENQVIVTKWSGVGPPGGQTTNVMYYIGRFKTVNWITAQRTCRHYGLQLASITSIEEQRVLDEAVLNHGGAYNGFWTSGADFASLDPRMFHWLSTGTPLSHTNWGKGQPNSWSENSTLWTGPQHCIMVRKESQTLVWDDRQCQQYHLFICELRKSTCAAHEFPSG